MSLISFCTTTCFFFLNIRVIKTMQNINTLQRWVDEISAFKFDAHHGFLAEANGHGHWFTTINISFRVS